VASQDGGDLLDVVDVRAIAHPEILAALSEWTGDDLPTLADLGYEGEPATFTLPVKKPKNATLTDEHKQLNWLQAHARARTEQATRCSRPYATSASTRRGGSSTGGCRC
jgi:hypothetical protein